MSKRRSIYLRCVDGPCADEFHAVFDLLKYGDMVVVYKKQKIAEYLDDKQHDHTMVQERHCYVVRQLNNQREAPVYWLQYIPEGTNPNFMPELHALRNHFMRQE